MVVYGGVWLEVRLGLRKARSVPLRGDMTFSKPGQ
jgi:hypothetical protein